MAKQNITQSFEEIEEQGFSLFDAVMLVLPLVIALMAIWGLSGHPLYAEGKCWVNCEAVED